MFLGGIIFSIGVIFFFLQARVWSYPLESYIFPTLIIGLICTAVESLPIEEYDNITVPVIALMIGQLILPKG